MGEAAATGSGGLIARYFRGFAVLRDTGREFWGMQIYNVLDNMAYNATYVLGAVLLSQDFGFDDKAAGYIVAAFTMGITISLFFTGVITDWMGIRKSINISMVGLFVLRILMVAAMLRVDFPLRRLIGPAAMIAMAPFMAVGTTALQASNKRYTTARSRGAGFNVWYLLMNFGFFLSGMYIDFIRNWLKLHNAYVIGIGIPIAVICLVTNITLIRHEDQSYGPDEVPEPKSVSTARRKPLDIAWAVVSESAFWRFLALFALMMAVRAAFLYMSLLYPKYWLRVIGPDAMIGTMQAVNPFLVTIGLIVLIPIVSRFNVYSMLTYGALVSASSLFIMAIPAWGNAAYYTSLASLMVLSVGEVTWSPRLTQYTTAIAPKGQEGTYYGLSQAPWFGTKMVVSTLSGHMLARWAPEFPKGEPILRDRLAAGQIPFWHSPSALWIILGTAALLGPTIAIMLRGWFTKGAHWKTETAPNKPAAGRQCACGHTNGAEAEVCGGCGVRLQPAPA
jgi:MFS family permease